MNVELSRSVAEVKGMELRIIYDKQNKNTVNTKLNILKYSESHKEYHG